MKPEIFTSNSDEFVCSWGCMHLSVENRNCKFYQSDLENTIIGDVYRCGKCVEDYPVKDN